MSLAEWATRDAGSAAGQRKQERKDRTIGSGLALRWASGSFDQEPVSGHWRVVSTSRSRWRKMSPQASLPVVKEAWDDWRLMSRACSPPEETVTRSLLVRLTGQQ